jgi:hypothetical protein
MQKVFIIGSHRTGTMTFANFFDKYFNNVYSYHQYKGLRAIYILSNIYLMKNKYKNVLYKFIKYYIVRHIEKHPNNNNIYLVSNGFNYIAVDILKEIYDDIKIIHIVRDPRDFVTSYINFINTRWQSWLANNLIPFWNVSGYKIEEFNKKEWKKLSQFEKFCWHWKFKNTKIFELYGNDKNNYYFFKFEDIINKKTRKKSLIKLLNFIGLEYIENCENFFNKKYNISKRKILPDWQEWDTDKSIMLNNICSELMQKYNYGNEI